MPAKAKISAPALIPQPASVTVSRGKVTLKSPLALSVHPNQQAELKDCVSWLRSYFGAKPAGKSKAPGLRLDLDASLSSLCGEEGYLLESSRSGVLIRAAKPAGIFYGCQTLRQLAPPAWEKKKQANLVLPIVRIQDQPKNAWRGLMMDSCRHFMPLPIVKRLLDQMAAHKFNVFHWHLTEDQAWRIEIKRYPKLTSQSAWRKEADGKRSGGYYRQNEVREIVEYARKLSIQVVPEIEMPGHCRAALHAYPELSCTGVRQDVPATWGIFKDVYCAGKDSVLRFNKNVLDEVIALFPSHWVHIGGDEAPKDRWAVHDLCQKRMRKHGLKDEKELQSWFLDQIAEHLNKRGKGLMGWDEIHEGGFPKGDVRVHWWANEKAGRQAAAEGYEVINSNWPQCYVDHGYHAINTRTMFGYTAAPKGIPKAQRKLFIGGEAPLWSEGIWPKDLDQRLYPRVLGFIEALWSESPAKAWPGFEAREKAHLERLKLMGVKPRDPGVKVGRISGPVGRPWKRSAEYKVGPALSGGGSYRLVLERLEGELVKVERVELWCGRKLVQKGSWGNECKKNVNFPHMDFEIPKPWVKRDWRLRITLKSPGRDQAAVDAFVVKQP